jgi:hypothetical protein
LAFAGTGAAQRVCALRTILCLPTYGGVVHCSRLRNLRKPHIRFQPCVACAWRAMHCMNRSMTSSGYFKRMACNSSVQFPAGHHRPCQSCNKRHRNNRLQQSTHRQGQDKYSVKQLRISIFSKSKLFAPKDFILFDINNKTRHAT